MKGITYLLYVLINFLFINLISTKSVCANTCINRILCMYIPQKTDSYNLIKIFFVKKTSKQVGFEMAKTLIWPFWNGQAISKPLKSFKMAMAVSKWPKVSKRQVTRACPIKGFRAIFDVHVLKISNVPSSSTIHMSSTLVKILYT